RRVSSSPNSRMWMREDPPCASMSTTDPCSTEAGSSTSSPSASPRSGPGVTRTPCSSRRPVTISTSRIAGTPRSTDGESPSSAATIAFGTRFLAPRTRTVPVSGTPPWTSSIRAPSESDTARTARQRTRSPGGRPCESYRIRPGGALRLRPARGCVSEDRQGRRLVRRADLLERLDVLLVLQGQPDVVEPLQQAPAGVVVDLERDRERVRGDDALDEVDRHLRARVVLEDLPDELDVRLLDLRGQQA